MPVSALSRILELARIDARRRRHETIDTEHFAFVALDVSDVAAAIRQRGIDPAELRERLDGALTARSSVGGYRDGTTAEVSPELRRLLDGDRRRRWTPFRKSLPFDQVLLDQPSIASVVFELRGGNDYRYVIERARALAVSRRHAAVGVVHALRALVDLRSFVAAVERAEGDVARLASALDEVLHAIAPGSHDRPPTLDPSLQAVVDAAKTMASTYGAAPPTIRQLCLQLAVAAEAAPFWDASCTTAAEFVRAVHLPDSTRSGALLR
jgi:ATP-dependent Clp protease ATP-binding subunit ClpA